MINGLHCQTRPPATAPAAPPTYLWNSGFKLLRRCGTGQMSLVAVTSMFWTPQQMLTRHPSHPPLMGQVAHATPSAVPRCRWSARCLPCELQICAWRPSQQRVGKPEPSHPNPLRVAFHGLAAWNDCECRGCVLESRAVEGYQGLLRPYHRWFLEAVSRTQHGAGHLQSQVEG